MFKVDELPRNGPQCLCEIFFSSSSLFAIYFAACDVLDKFSITVYVWCSYLSCWARLYLASHSGVDFFLSCHRCCWQRYTSSVDERLKHWHLKQYGDILSFIAYHKNAHCVDFHPSTCTSTDTCSRWQCSGWYVIATFVNMNAVLNATWVPVVN